MDRVFKSPGFSLDFVQSMQELWRNGKLCDASIEVGSRVFKFHKIVLSVASTAFVTMGENVATDNRMVIQLPVDTEIQALESMLQYVYGGELHITSSTVDTIQKLANMFKIDKIVEFCDLFRSEINDSSEMSRHKRSNIKKRKLSDVVTTETRPGGLKPGLKPSRGRGRRLTEKGMLPSLGRGKGQCDALSSRGLCGVLSHGSRGSVTSIAGRKGALSRRGRGGKLVSGRGRGRVLSRRGRGRRIGSARGRGVISSRGHGVALAFRGEECATSTRGQGGRGVARSVGERNVPPARGRGRVLSTRGRGESPISSRGRVGLLSPRGCGGNASARGRGGVLSPRCHRRGRGRGKTPVATLLQACNLKTESLVFDTDAETASFNTDCHGLLNGSPQSRKAKVKSEELRSALIADGDVQNSQHKDMLSSDVTPNIVKQEIPGMELLPRRRGRKPGQRSSLTRAEIQRAYRQRRFSNMTPEELALFRERERQRAKTKAVVNQIAMKVENPGRGRGRRSYLYERGGYARNNIASSNHCGDYEDFSVINEGDGMYDHEIEKIIVKRKNTERQKRYRDKKKNDPAWMQKEADRVKKRYVPVSQLSPVEHDMRRIKETERTRMWRWRKKLQDFQVPIELVTDAQRVDDFSGTMFMLQTPHIDSSFTETVQSNPTCMNTVNNVVSSLNSEFNYMLSGEGAELEVLIKQEAIDPEYNTEHSVILPINQMEMETDSIMVTVNEPDQETDGCTDSAGSDVNQTDIDSGNVRKIASSTENVCEPAELSGAEDDDNQSLSIPNNESIIGNENVHFNKDETESTDLSDDTNIELNSELQEGSVNDFSVMSSTYSTSVQLDEHETETIGTFEETNTDLDTEIQGDLSVASSTYTSVQFAGQTGAS